jgi:hypothetical protein
MPTPLEIFANPFNKDSAHHRPLTDAAVYGAPGEPMTDLWIATVPANNGQPGGGTQGFINPGSPYGVNTLIELESNPERPLEQRNCNDSGSAPSTAPWDFNKPATLRIPDNSFAEIPGSDVPQCAVDRLVCTLRLPHSALRFIETFETNRKNSPPVYRARIARNVDMTGLGHGSTLGQRVGATATGSSVLLGAIRKEEIDNDIPITHAIKLAVWWRDSQPWQLISREIQWPATAGDGGANKEDHANGLLPYGLCLAIPRQITLTQDMFLTNFGFRLSLALQQYGAYIMDAAGGIIARAEKSVGTEGRNDFRRCLALLRPVLNNVDGATAEIVKGGSRGQTNGGSIGTPGAAYNGTPLAPNTAFDANGATPPPPPPAPTMITIAGAVARRIVQS